MSITLAAAAQRGHVALTVMVADESRVDDISEILNECGAIDVDEKEQQSMAFGNLTGSPTNPSGASLAGGMMGETAASALDNMSHWPAASMTGMGNSDTLKPAKENVQVGKQMVQKGSVRVHQRLVETPVEEQVAWRDERALI